MGLHVLYPETYAGGSWGSTVANVDDPYGSPDGVGVPWDASNDSEATYNLTPMRDALSIQNVQVYSIWGANSGVGRTVRVLIYRSGSPFYGTYIEMASGAGAAVAFDWALDPLDGLPWTKAKLDALVAGASAKDTNGPLDTIVLDQLVVLVTYTPTGVADPTRKRATRALRQSARATQSVEISVPLHAGDVRIGGVLPVSHRDGTSNDGRGWGVEIDERRPTIVIGKHYDPARYRFRLSTLDMVPGVGLYSLYRSLRSKSPAAASLPGVARGDAGLTDLLVRASRAFVETVDGRIVGVGADEFKTERRGTLFEPARDNLLQRSSMIAGVTGLTAVGTAGQSTADPDDLLFDKSESGFSLKIVANGSADQGRTWPATAALVAGDDCVLSIDYANNSGLAVYARLTRSTDGFYLNSSGTFVSGVQNLALPVKTTRSPLNRWISPIFDVGSGTPTLTLSIVHLAADASGTTSHVYHVQIEKGLWASSRKVNDASVVTYAADLYTVAGVRAPLPLPVPFGTVFALVRADWNSADVGSSAFRWLDLPYNLDNNNRELFRYANGIWRSGRVIAGSTVDAQFTGAITRGTYYVVARRHVGLAGELGLAPGTCSIFVNGVRGTDAVPPAGPITPAPSFPATLAIGSSAMGGAEWGGSLAEVLGSPLVLDDAQIADYSAYILATAAS